MHQLHQRTRDCRFRRDLMRPTHDEVGSGRAGPLRVGQPRKAGCGPPQRYFLGLSAAAASLAVGTVPPDAWVRLISDSVAPTKTSSIRP